MCETFFLGAARKIPSQISERMSGIVIDKVVGRSRLYRRAGDLEENNDHVRELGAVADSDSRGNIGDNKAEGFKRSAMIAI